MYDEDKDYEDGDYDYDGSSLEFADPGGRSALRAATGDRCPSCKKRVGLRALFCSHCGAGLNPRCLPCPNCGAKNRLTPKDRQLGYQCDRCADRAERGFDY